MKVKVSFCLFNRSLQQSLEVKDLISLNNQSKHLLIGLSTGIMMMPHHNSHCAGETSLITWTIGHKVIKSAAMISPLISIKDMSISINLKANSFYQRKEVWTIVKKNRKMKRRKKRREKSKKKRRNNSKEKRKKKRNRKRKKRSLLMFQIKSLASKMICQLQKKKLSTLRSRKLPELL